jgi:hypothetical protein
MTPSNYDRAKYVGTPGDESGYFPLMFGPDTAAHTQQVVSGLREIAAQLDIMVA